MKIPKRITLIPIFVIIVMSPLILIGQNCFDADFESGTLGGYTAYHGEITLEGMVLFPNQGLSSTQHRIMRVSDGYDPIAQQFCDQNKNLLVAGSGTGKYTLRLGDVENGAMTSKVTLTLDVTDEVSFFLLKYAIVINDPQHDHVVQPRFELNIKDENDNILECGEYKVRAAENIEGFESCESWRVRPWTTAGFELASYLGQRIMIEIISTDCGLGGHGGYAYIDATCTPLELELESYCPENSFARYVVTEGFEEYEWATGETTRVLEIDDPMPGDTYEVTVTSSTGCTLILRDTLPEFPNIENLEPSYFDGPDSLNVCFGEAVIYRPTGTNIDQVNALELGYSSDEFIIYAEEDQVYNFVTGDNFGCAYDTTQLHLFVQNLDVEFETINSCDGFADGEIIVNNINNISLQTALNNTDYQDNFHYINLVPGEYVLNLKYGDNCEVSNTILILEKEVPELQDIQVTPSTCNKENGEIKMISNYFGPPFQYSIDGSDFSSQSTWNDLHGGSYVIKFRHGDDGCEREAIVLVPSYDPPELNVIQVDSSLCSNNNGKIVLDANDGYPPLLYSIDGVTFIDSSSFHSLYPSEYTLFVKDASDCRDTISVNIYGAPYVEIDSIETRPATCEEDNGTIIVAVSDSLLPYHLYVDSVLSTIPKARGISGGVHHISTIDHNGCEDEMTTFVNEIPAPTIDSIIYAHQVCSEELLNIKILASSHNDSLRYGIDAGLFKAENSFDVLPDEYIFSIQDDTGCIIDSMVVVHSDEWLSMPNIFSPDNDGLYDFFCCPTLDNIEVIEEFFIYDRWGNSVFSRTNAPFTEETCWDGTFNSRNAENGVYVYFIKVRFYDGRVICKLGDVTVAR